MRDLDVTLGALERSEDIEFVLAVEPFHIFGFATLEKHAESIDYLPVVAGVFDRIQKGLLFGPWNVFRCSSQSCFLVLLGSLRIVHS